MRILLVDKDEQFMTRAGALFARWDPRAVFVVAGSPSDALAAAATATPDVLLMDATMRHGLRMVHAMRQPDGRLPFLTVALVPAAGASPRRLSETVDMCVAKSEFEAVVPDIVAIGMKLSARRAAGDEEACA